MKWNGLWVAHDCRNPECNNGWIDKDLTNAKINPPKWKYCRECCEKLGIDFDAQTPTSNLTEKELAYRKILFERAKKATEMSAKIRSKKNKSQATEGG